MTFDVFLRLAQSFEKNVKLYVMQMRYAGVALLPTRKDPGRPIRRRNESPKNKFPHA